MVTVRLHRTILSVNSSDFNSVKSIGRGDVLESEDQWFEARLVSLHEQDTEPSQSHLSSHQLVEAVKAIPPQGPENTPPLRLPLPYKLI